MAISECCRGHKNSSIYIVNEEQRQKEWRQCKVDEFEKLRKQKVTDHQVREYIELLLPLEKDAGAATVRNVKRLRSDMEARYFDAPDLKDMGRNAYRLINAVSDFATHAEPIRRTKNYQENLFMRTYEGNPMIDKAYQLVSA